MKRDNMKEIIVKRKNVYGNELIYPICNTAKLFQALTGGVTLGKTDIAIIKRLGYTFKTESEVI